MVYEITSFKEVTTRYSTKMILSLRTKEGEQYTVWAPDQMAAQISEKHKFVYNKGLVQSKKDPSRQYWDFSLT